MREERSLFSSQSSSSQTLLFQKIIPNDPILHHSSRDSDAMFASNMPPHPLSPTKHPSVEANNENMKKQRTTDRVKLPLLSPDTPSSDKSPNSLCSSGPLMASTTMPSTAMHQDISARKISFSSDDHESISSSLKFSPQVTPKHQKWNDKFPSSTTAATFTDSSFRQSTHGQRTPMTHHSGSPFKTFHPRCDHSVSSSTDLSTDKARPSAPGNFKECRRVPLTVLSRNGTPNTKASPTVGPQSESKTSNQSIVSPYRHRNHHHSSPSQFFSPLLQSLDQIAKEDKEMDDAVDKDIVAFRKFQEDLFSPKPEERVSSTVQGSTLAWSNIKLAPRNQKKAPSNTHGIGAEEVKESFLGPPSLAPLVLPPAHRGSSNAHHSTLQLSGRHMFNANEEDHVSCPPVLSIAFDCNAESLKIPPTRNMQVSNAGFLPRPLTKPKASRSILNYCSHSFDPIDQLIQEDAIAEAAQWDEPLTDDESESEHDCSGFILLSPEDTYIEKKKNFTSLNMRRKYEMPRLSVSNAKAATSLLGIEFSEQNDSKHRNGVLSKNNHKSELSLNSLGFSVDSQPDPRPSTRDFKTPSPVITKSCNSFPTLSKPMLQPRSINVSN